MKMLFGGILLAVGLLIAGASGLCSLAVLFSGGGSDWSMLPLVGVVGGIPFAVGAGLVFAGQLLIRKARRAAKPDERSMADIFE